MFKDSQGNVLGPTTPLRYEVATVVVQYTIICLFFFFFDISYRATYTQYQYILSLAVFTPWITTHPNIGTHICTLTTKDKECSVLSIEFSINKIIFMFVIFKMQWLLHKRKKVWYYPQENYIFFMSSRSGTMFSTKTIITIVFVSCSAKRFLD